MTFRDIAFKNFKANLKKYLSYFWCSSFSIMIFFMYASMLFNPAVEHESDQGAIRIMLGICLTVVALFSVFFINYAHTAFIRSRYKEFGIYMTLGMTGENIRSLILFENLLIIFFSLVSGLVTGLIFSRLFQMVVVSLFGIQHFTYGVSALSFLLTVGMFLIVFLLVLTFSRITTAKLQISALLKKARENEERLRMRIVPGLLGLILLIASLCAFVFISGYDKLNSNYALVIPIVLLVFAGVYFTISFMGMTLMAVLKHCKKVYYKNMLVITEILNKFNQNKKIIFVLSILSAMIVFFVSSPFSQYSLSEKFSGMSQPNHLEFVTVYGINKFETSTLESILNNGGTKVTAHYDVEFLALSLQSGLTSADPLGAKPVISVSSYNRMTGSHLTVPNGQVFNAVPGWMPGTYGITAGEQVSLLTEKGNVNLKVTDSRRAPWIDSGNSFPASSGFVVSDAEYAQLKAQTASDSVGVYHIYNFGDWKKTGNLTKSLRFTLNQANTQLSTAQAAKVKQLPVITRLEVYDSLKRDYSTFMFVTTIMGILFFIAAGSVLFFKHYTEVGAARQKFYKLFKIGMTKKEASKVITREIFVTFFSPLIFGSVLGYTFIYYMTHLFGGQGVLSAFMQNCTKVVAAYFVFQALFFLMTRKKYINEVLDEF